MAKVTITITTKPVELNPGEEAGILRLIITGPDNYRLEAQLESNVYTLPDVRTGNYRVEVQCLDQNNIGLGEPVVQNFSVTLDQVRTYNAPTGLSIVVTK